MDDKPKCDLVLRIVYSGVIVSLTFIISLTLLFRTSQWDNFAAIGVFFPAYYTEGTLLADIIKFFTTHYSAIDIFRPTGNLLIALQIKLFGYQFTLYHILVSLIYIGTLILISQRLALLSISKFGIYLFLVLAVSHPAPAIYSQFASDPQMIFFNCVLLEITIIYLKSDKLRKTIIFGILATIACILSAGTKELAPFLSFLVILTGIALAGFSWRTAWRSVPIFLTTLYPLLVIIPLGMKRTGGGWLGLHIYVNRFTEGFLRVQPIGMSWTLAIVCSLLIGTGVLLCIRKTCICSNKCLIWLLFCLCYVCITLGFYSYSITNYVHYIVDRYVFPPAMIWAGGIAVACDLLMKLLLPKITFFPRAFLRYTYGGLMTFVLILGISVHAIQINAYYSFYNHHYNSFYGISSLLSEGENNIALCKIDGERDYHIRQFFSKEHYGDYLLEPYEFKDVDNLNNENSFWIYLSGLEQFFSGFLNRYTPGQIVNVKIAREEQSVFLHLIGKLYSSLFRPRFDSFPAYYTERGELVGKHALIKIINPHINTQAPLTLLKSVKHDSKLDNSLGEYNIDEQAGEFEYEASFNKTYYSTLGVLVAGKIDIKSEKLHEITIGIKHKNSSDFISQRAKSGLSAKWDSESKRFTIYFEVPELVVGDEYRVVISGNSVRTGDIKISESINILPVKYL